ncbi:MAG: penicillin-binding protein 2 [Coxiellaceae bacterium]|nr:penicillin-binding protein 2 [Coxiellaceae bacterium]
MKHQQDQAIFKRRFTHLLVCVCVVLLVLLGRLFYLEIIDHKQYITLSRKNFLNIKAITPERGLIYDRHGVLLAKNAPSFTLSLIPSKIKDMNKTLQELQKLLNINDTIIERFKRHLNQYHAYDLAPLPIKLNEQQMDQFYVNAYRFPGVSIETLWQREYPLESIGSSVVGYVGKVNANDLTHVIPENYRGTNYIGKTGIEKGLENSLHGKTGIEQVEIDARGKIIHSLGQELAASGSTLHLTIDSRLQDFIIKTLGKLSAAVVAIDPSNGEILAMVSTPTYDTNLFSQGMSIKEYQSLSNNPHHPLYNKTIQGLYSPGSTIKPFYAVSALDNGIITPETYINDPGWFTLPNSTHKFRDWKPQGHGKVNISKALMVSCDTFFYWLSTKMGIALIDHTLKTFGFGSLTHINLPSELDGTIPSPDWKVSHQGSPWYTGDTVITGIGQGSLLVTPLQLASATATLAMHGKHFQPHLVHSIQTKSDQSTLIKPQLISTITLNDPHNWDIVIDALQDVVRSPHGTARYFGPHNYTVAAKTGTAQVYGHHRDEVYVQNNVPWKLRNNHLFIDFAPVEQPKIALALVIEHDGGADRIAGLITTYYLTHCLDGTHNTDELSQLSKNNS